MELTPGAIITAVVAVAATFVLIRWSRRNEAAAPGDAPVHTVRVSAMAAPMRNESDPLVRWLFERAHEQTGISVAEDPLAHDRIVQAAAKAKEEMRATGSATISLPFLSADASGPKHFTVRFTRKTDSTFELQR